MAGRSSTVLVVLSSFNKLLTRLYRAGYGCQRGFGAFVHANRHQAEWTDQVNGRANFVSVAILAGGMSRRMGRNKAMLKISSRTLIQIVADRVSAAAGETFVVASNGQPYEELGFRVVPDVLPNTGALGGVYSALRSARFDHCLVVACDMPLIDPGLLQYMIDLPRGYDVAIPVLPADRSDQGGSETFETLHAIYAKSALPVIERHLGAGRLKIADILESLRVSRIEQNVIRRYDPEFLSFFNVNSRADFEKLRELLGSDD
jgi:molybdopterin-guanine dinucleotide biosynthesis protein A